MKIRSILTHSLRPSDDFGAKTAEYRAWLKNTIKDCNSPWDWGARGGLFTHPACVEGLSALEDIVSSWILNAPSTA